jgi:hypothetical protein
MQEKIENELKTIEFPKLNFQNLSNKICLLNLKSLKIKIHSNQLVPVNS